MMYVPLEFRGYKKLYINLEIWKISKGEQEYEKNISA